MYCGSSMDLLSMWEEHLPYSSSDVLQVSDKAHRRALGRGGDVWVNMHLLLLQGWGYYMRLVYRKQHATVSSWNVLLGGQTWWLCPALNLAHFSASFPVYHSSNLRRLIVTLRIFTKVSSPRTVFSWAVLFIDLRQVCQIFLNTSLQPGLPATYSPGPCPVTFPVFTNLYLGSYFQQATALLPSSLSGLLLMLCYE